MTAPIQLSRKKASRNPDLLWQRLSEFLSFADIKLLTPAQKVAYLAYTYETDVVDIGGHHDYFSNSGVDFTEVVCALQTVGAKRPAEILKAALEAVRLASENAPRKYANRFLAGVEFADLAEFDDALGGCVPTTRACLMNYLARHEGEFVDWKP